jgi:hypothetical protein
MKLKCWLLPVAGALALGFAAVPAQAIGAVTRDLGIRQTQVLSSSTIGIVIIAAIIITGTIGIGRVSIFISARGIIIATIGVVGAGEHLAWCCQDTRGLTGRVSPFPQVLAAVAR